MVSNRLFTQNYTATGGSACDPIAVIVASGVAIIWRYAASG